MNLEDELLKENSKKQVLYISNYIGENITLFDELMEMFINGNKRVNQRAAAVVNYVGEHKEDMLKPYWTRMVSNLNNERSHDAVKRNTLRLLQFVEIPKNLYGEIINVCFDFMSSQSEAIAIKVFSMTVLSKISYYIPEIKNELRILIEDQLPYGSAGFRSRGNKILKELNIMHK